MVPPHCGPCMQASSPSRIRFGDVSDADYQSSTIVADLRRTLRRMDYQAQQRGTPGADFGHAIGDATAAARCIYASIHPAGYTRADLVVLAGGDAVVPLDQTHSVSRLCVALAQSERSSAARRRRMEAVVAEPVDLRAQLKTTQVEAATWQSAELKTIGVIESLKKSIFTLKTEAYRVSAQRADRLKSAENIISSLQLAIQARDREISRLTCRASRPTSRYPRRHDGVLSSAARSYHGHV